MSRSVALIDLGSNAVRFVLAQVTPGVGYRILRKARSQTRLGSGVNGQLNPRAVRETLQAIRGFLQTLDQDRDLKLLAVATAAVREAGARDSLLGPLRRDAGIEVTILGGQEEALLGALAAVHSLDVASGLVVDLGGRSLQVAEVRERSVSSAQSFPLGAVRMTERFLHHDPPLPEEIERVRREVRRHLTGALPKVRKPGGVVGLGGTVRTLARIHLGLEYDQDDSRQGLRLPRLAITAIRENLQTLSFRGRQRVPGLKPERADIILAGAVVVEELMILAGCPALTVCKTGVRDGILLHEAFNTNGASSPGLALRGSARPAMGYGWLWSGGNGSGKPREVVRESSRRSY
jgi:exopolyphosphatase/guanosine-5'-triphosphate,3'-diphosphate pyrophosphatase